MAKKQGGKMYKGSPVVLDAKSIVGMDPEDLRRMEQIAGWFVGWSGRLGLHPDTRIVIRYVGDPIDDSGAPDTYLMLCDDGKADYHQWRLDVSSRCLAPRRDQWRESDVVHEVLHMLLYPHYTRTAYYLADESARDLLRRSEESLVTALETAIVRLVYGDDCNPVPENAA